MARKKKTDTTTQNDTSMQDWNRSLGYSSKALKALESGTYDELTNRNVSSMKSDDQVRIANPVPVLKGVNTDNTDLELRFGKARQYQKNLENEAKKYQYDQKAAAANTLDDKDREFMKGIMAQSNEEAQRKMLESKYNKEGWGQKYGKTVDEIYRDYVADQRNETMRQGEKNPFLSSIYSTIADLGTPILTLPSLLANAIKPDSEFAKKAEEHRAHYSDNRKLMRAGVKENTGEKGDNVLDTIFQVGDRMANAAAGKAVLGNIGSGIMTGLSDASQQMDQLNLRPGMSNRQKALSSLAHGTVEGAGTAITTGLLDGLPTVNGIGGKLINVGKGAGNAAIENGVAEAIEMGLDTAINGENSEKALNKAIYMMQGMSEADAEKQVKADQASRVKGAAVTGALFGGGMKGIGELANSLPFLKGVVEEPTVDTSDIDNVVAKATDQAEGAKAEINRLAQQIPEAPEVEAPTKANPTDLPQRRLPASEKYSIQTVYAEDGSPRYFVRENTSDTGSKPVEPGKVYKTAEEAQKALENLKSKATSAPVETAPEGIQVYRGYNRSNNPLETNLAKQKSIYDVLGKEDPNKVDMLPLEYYTDSMDDATHYANHDKEFYDSLETMARGDLIRAYERGKDIPNGEAFIKNSMDEAYRTLTGREPNFDNSHVDTHTINPQNLLDLTDIGESAYIDDIYKHLSKLTGISPSELDDVLRLGALSIDDDMVPAYSVLRNMGSDEGAIGSRFVDFMRDKGYDAVKYRESGANHYAVLNDGTPKAENNVLPTATAGGGMPPEPPEPPKGPNGPETDISQRYETLKNSDLFQKSQANMKMLETAKQQGVFNKDIEGRAQAQADALKEFTEDPTKAINDNLNKQWSSGKDMDTSMIVLNDALDTGSQAYANLVMLKQAQQVKGAGRVLRAALDYAKKNYAGTKEGTLQEAAKFLNDKADALLKNRKTAEQFDAIAQRIMNGDLSDLNTRFNMDDVNIQNIKDALEAGAGKADIAHMIAMYQSVGKTGISADALQKVTDIYNQIQSQNLEPNSRARANLEADAFKVLAQDIGGKRTFKEQWDAWRYLAMLGNPKTHLRNILGNTTHYMVTEAKDNIGAVMEAALDKANKATGGEGIERTKAVLNANDKGLVKAGELDADNVAYAALNDSGSKYNVKSEIDRARQAFNNKLLSKIDGLNSNLLDVEDYSALKRKYSKSLARYLKANGADESIFKATDDASKALLDKARAYAIDQAKQATFHEYSKTAAMLSRFSNDMANSDKLHHKAASYMLEGVLPFKKTPINILKQGGKYSPISLATGLKKAFDAVQTGNSTAAEAIEDLSAGLTGTGIMGLGMFLASQGFLTGSANPDYTVDQAETEQGAQNYALKIGDNSYTLDWLAPMSLPLFVGVELNRLMNEDDDEGLTLNKAISALSTIAEPITEMSMLQGINDVLEKLSYDPAGALAGLATQTGLGYITQGVPTVAGQFARAIDDTRRSTYSENTGMEKSLDQAMMKVQNKIPFLSQSSQPYVTASGQEQQNEGLASYWLGDNFGTRLMDQMLSPGYFKEGTISDTDKELNRLYEATGEVPYKNVLKGEVDGQKLGKESFTSYQKLYGSNIDYLYDEIIKSDEYKNLDDAEKVKTLKNIREKSKMIADHEIGGKALEKSDQKIYDIYKSKGKDGLLQYIKDKTMADSLDMKYDDYVKKESENPGGAMQWAEDKQTAADMGFTKKDGTVDIQGYEDAVEMFGNNVPAIQSYKEYKSQGFTKNAEKVPYLMDNNAFTDEEKGKILAGSKTYDDLGKTAKGAYDIEGYAGLYYFYLLKQLADTDGNGSIKKAERDALLNSDNPYVTALSDDMYYYLAGQSW